MPSALENQIEAYRRKIDVLDSRIVRLTSQRAVLENTLAKFYARLAVPRPLGEVLDADEIVCSVDTR